MNHLINTVVNNECASSKLETLNETFRQSGILCHELTYVCETTYGSIDIPTNSYEYNQINTTENTEQAFRSVRLLKRIRGSRVIDVSCNSTAAPVSIDIICYDDNQDIIETVAFTNSHEIPAGTAWMMVCAHYAERIEALPMMTIVVQSQYTEKAYASRKYSEDVCFIRYSFPMRMPVKAYYRSDTFVIRNDSSGTADSSCILTPETVPSVNVSNETALDTGYIYLPPNYDHLGENTVPLAIFCHGTGGFGPKDTSLTSTGSYNAYLRYVADCGYAVADCSGFTSKYVNDPQYAGAINAKNSRFQPIIASSYVNLVKYLLKSYNISPDGVYMFGKSNGGQAPLYFGSVQPFKVRAVVSLAGTNSIINSFRYTRATSVNWLAHCFDMDEHDFRLDAAENRYLFQTESTADKEYLIEMADKYAEYDPFIVNSNIDPKEYARAILKYGYLEDRNDDAHLRSECWELVANARKYNTAPTKLFQAVDDNDVPSVYAKLYTRMVKNSGGICEYCEYRAGLGAHHAVDTAINAPKVTVKPRFKDIAVTVPAAYAETVEWFDSW